MTLSPLLYYIGIPFSCVVFFFLTKKVQTFTGQVVGCDDIEVSRGKG